MNAKEKCKPTPEEKCEDMTTWNCGKCGMIVEHPSDPHTCKPSPSPEARVDWENFIQKTINDETVRNNPETAVHEFSEVCSCWTCHLSSILARRIQAAFEKGREAR